ncbi:MAG TPA: LCP family protein [Candidatus Eisenbergiella pullicola]|nr:LCP family protein [Candidatus Eisenbergiella pullicola]
MKGETRIREAETTREKSRKRRKRHRSGRNRKPNRSRTLGKRLAFAALIAAGVLLFLLLAGVCAYAWMEYAGRAELKKKQEALPEGMILEETSAAEELPEDAEGQEPLKDGMLRYQGKTYAYKEDVMTFLCMGIDKSGEAKASEDLHRGGQADALFLAVMDPGEKKISVIGVNRDTMAKLFVYDEEGNYLGREIGQIALQHAYGDGMEESCERTVEAVSNLFYGIPIHGYFAMNMDVIIPLNEAVGGVDVVIGEGDEKVHLEGQEAYSFVRNRDMYAPHSAEQRLERQKQYLEAFALRAKKAVAQDLTLPAKLYGEILPYMVTDISASEAVYLATQAVSYTFGQEDLYSLQGEIRMGEQFEEFYPDETALYELILQVFYEEV